MDLSHKTEANIELMLEAIKERLQLVNRDVLKASAFSVDCYEDLHDIYKLVNKKKSFSIFEMEGILDELKALRKRD
ncbi:DUF1128 domain-containing protein [Camelliibacillus cellulosilyticus]|uniref:DUF1128 domain-containing protein n=1 Tax=Camelliibacillus cellulosilyticus TaxID=2174486 RepID=A0ABV9GJH7_9BACL